MKCEHEFLVTLQGRCANVGKAESSKCWTARQSGVDGIDSYLWPKEVHRKTEVEGSQGRMIEFGESLALDVVRARAPLSLNTRQVKVVLSTVG